MKMKRTLKRLAASLMLTASILGLAAPAAADEIVRVIGSGNEVLASHPATAVSYLEFSEAPVTIEIPLSETVKFKMIKVEGGVQYTLKHTGITWTEGKTKTIEDFWLGEFVVTQGVWKEVMGITSDDDLPVSNRAYTSDGVTYPVGSKQSAFGDFYPIANVSWDDIMGENGFLVKINGRLKELKDKYPELKTALGEKEFRLPSEWEWEYAAARGKKYTSLGYYYIGTKQSMTEALQKVAVNSVSPNKATSVGLVGSKLPNELGFYDMSGNVWEWCNGLGYPGQTDAGYLNNSNQWSSSTRPRRGGSWSYAEANYFQVSGRNSAATSDRHNVYGFRLAM